MLGRAPRTRETLPDFCENMNPNKWDTTVWYRVTQNPQEFYGLTGFQRDPRIWGVTGLFGGGWFVQEVLIEDMSHCYDIFRLYHVSIGCHTRAYPSNFAFTIFNLDFQTSISAYQAFRLPLHMDQMFRLHLYHIC